ncbi:BGTF surface domain-containing protein [Halorubrum tebenquichense]|uniref:Cell surface glycoprotein n=1 Tax=Halorubrum tebenquichense DSM 14210 TaxID=1227485 RepID=M0DVH2_9EURY|nr:BGTF surface domain-containing protein [Halorubrum tebenquichense]ELZ38833.1 hypothetical protein C472_06285 [Halorubrum tebenquichense DSM 14210]
MTSERPPDDADRPADDPTSRDERPAAAEPTARRSTHRAAGLALVACLALVAAAAAGPGAVALSPEGPTPTAQAGDAAPLTADNRQAIDARSSDRAEISGGFSRDVYTGIAGDPVRIRHAVDASDGDEAYLLIGGNRLTDTGQSVGFVDVVRVTGSETTINTRTLGTDATNVESCSEVDCNIEFQNEDGDVIAENLSELSGATGAGGLPRPIAPQRYRLAITNGTFVVEDSGQVTPVEMAGRAELVLQKPTFHDEIEVFTTADRNDIPDTDPDAEESLDALRENGLDRTAVTKGDRVVLGFESSGIWGALSHFAGSTEDVEAGTELDHTVLDSFLGAEEGVSLRVRQTNPGRNQAASEFDLSAADSDDVSLILADASEGTAGDDDPTAGRFYLVLDTSDGGPFTRDPEPGDEFAVEFALEGTEGERYAFADGGEPPAAFDGTSSASGQFPYWEAADETVSAEASFSVRERYIRYDHVTDDGELLVEADGGTVTGTTSIIPVEEMAANFVNDAGEPIRTEASMEVSDGNFTIDADLDDVSPGTRLNYELYQGTSLKDSRNVVVVSNTSEPDRLAIENVTANVTVIEDGNLSALDVDVRNVGGVEGEGTLALDVDDGNLTASRDLTLSGNESRTVAFSSVSVDRLDPGEYQFSVALDNDVRNGTLVVTDDPAKTTLDDDDDAGDDGNGTDDGDSTDSSDAGEGGSADGSSTGSENGSESEDNGSESDGDSPDPDGEPGGEDGDDGAATFLPFGIGTRETFGGTVLVGATYLLGHWV